MIDLSKPNLRKVKVGTRVKTMRGVVWKLIARGKKGEKWLDETSKLLWLPIEYGNFNHAQAMAFETNDKKIPTKEEFETAEKHGIREVLNMRDRWFWSSSVYPDATDYACSAYYFNGGGGGIDYYDSSFSYGAAVCVSGRVVEK